MGPLQGNCPHAARTRLIALVLMAPSKIELGKSLAAAQGITAADGKRAVWCRRRVLNDERPTWLRLRDLVSAEPDYFDGRHAGRLARGAICHDGRTASGTGQCA